ncbi:MAG TPA: LacI family DNA-binding transcriptional regulator [Glycomyces sp.]|nr:LacI family DNA-binding transcriptional regulator [Glycomyces sp.]
MSPIRESAAREDEQGGRPLTIAQIAERAGVSLATVSKVLNGRDSVAPETRTLIEDIIRRYGYRRQKRPTKASPLIEVAFHRLRGPYEIEILNGVQRVAVEHRLGVVVSEREGRRIPGRDWIEDIMVRRPTGVIAVFANPTEEQRGRLASRSVPLVLVDPREGPDGASPSVSANNWSGGLAATRHLLGLGHRRIAAITGPEHALAARARLDGFRAAMDLAGVPIDPGLVRVADLRDGRRPARDLLRSNDLPTAVVVDGEALGVYRAAAEAGLRIPEDLSVVGYDDLPRAEWNIPPLTSVRQPLRDMAAIAADMILALAGDAPLPRHHVELATELVVRGSTAPPPPQPLR